MYRKDFRSFVTIIKRMKIQQRKRGLRKGAGDAEKRTKDAQADGAVEAAVREAAQAAQGNQKKRAGYTEFA